MQPLAGIADARGQLTLHKGMNILGGMVDLQLSGPQVGCDPGKSLTDGLTVRGGDDPLLLQHGCVRQTAGDILLGHAGVKGD